MTIHPSGAETMDLDQAQYNAEVAADLRRSFLSIGPVRVRSHPATDPAANRFILSVRLARQYWDSAQEGADELWESVSSWLGSKEHFIGANIASFNETRAKAGNQTVDYAFMDVEMGPVTFEFPMQDNAMPPIRSVADRFRELFNAGVFGPELPTRVRVMTAAVRSDDQNSADEKTDNLHGTWEIVLADASVRTLDAQAGSWA